MPTLGIQCDAKTFLQALLSKLPFRARPSWRARIEDLRREHPMPAIESKAQQLFRALDQPSGSGFKADRLLGWGPFARGPLTVVDVPGTHVGCLQEPNVQTLARHLDGALQRLHNMRRPAR